MLYFSEGIIHAQSVTSSAEVLLKFAERYCINFPSRPSSLRPRLGKEVVLVTGTTGNFGTDLLEKLLNDDSVEKVYALNRSASRAMERQEASFRARGYDEDILHSPKLSLLEGQLDLPGFGLEAGVLEEIRSSVTWIIHNAWRLNFNLPVDTFDVYLKGLRNLVDLALSSPYVQAPKVQYISSITVFQSCELPTPVPEIPMPASSALGSGYGESKWVGEYMLLKIASQERSLPIQIVRLAQICGDESGFWATDEWFPAIVKSAHLTRCLPDVDGDAAFVPNVPAAQALIEMRAAPNEILHLTHPRPPRLRALFASVAERLRVPLVPYDAWLSALAESSKGIPSQRSRAEYIAAVQQNPAIILLGFYCTRKFRPGKEMVQFLAVSTEHACAASMTLECLPELGDDIVDKWLAAWRAAGFLEHEG